MDNAQATHSRVEELVPTNAVHASAWKDEARLYIDT